uniref:Uncharacterized protein n=1 Tax=Physcomitrium patens TaxID=3218 RepID=A0A2K1J084_PHYPA|nr:hypothetical protein PHYPA_022841 [Physcomitrium patens]
MGCKLSFTVIRSRVSVYTGPRFRSCRLQEKLGNSALWGTWRWTIAVGGGLIMYQKVMYM